MKNQWFYTVMNREGNFINSNLMRRDTDDILEAIKFYELEDVENYVERLRRDMIFKIIKVDCLFSEVKS